MDNQKEQEARWRESLALLGLTEESAAPPKEPARQPVAPPPSPAPVPAQAEVDDFEDSPQAAEALPDAVDLGSDTEVEIIDAPDFEDEPMSVEEPGEENLEEGPPSGEEGDKPKRGRRRRRRGRRRGGDKPEGEEAAKTAPSEPAPPPREAERKTSRSNENNRDQRGNSNDNNRDQRGNRQGPPRPIRDRVEPVQAAAKVHAEERWEEEAPAAEMDDLDERQPMPADNEELDTLADWDVPSWQDLISSLHRPDR